MRRGSYSLPFRPQEILEGRELPFELDLERSVADHLSLLLRTAPGEVPGDPDYGCRIWEHLAEPMRGESWLSQLMEDVRSAVVAHESRLGQVAVDITPSRSEANDLTLTIQGRLVPSEKAFRYQRVLRTDPIRIT